MSKTGILVVIVVAQFLCTSVWFAGNAVIPELITEFHLNGSALGHITSAVQLGFIAGTLAFAILTISDRYSPVKVFFCSSLLAAGFNLGVTSLGHSLAGLLSLRFFTGFFLAGVYPVGMKIASDHYGGKLGKALGFLVGALVLGTAFPHLIRYLGLQVSWKTVFTVTTSLAVTGGLLMLVLVSDGEHRQSSTGFNATVLIKVFTKRAFRTITFGYFGHMWELYAFWAFVPVILSGYAALHSIRTFNISLLSFLIIGCGSIACVVSGILSQSAGAKKTATVALVGSGICCLLSPLAFYFSPAFFIAFLLIWGLLVIADSPMFSTMVAQNAPVSAKGTALTIVTCLGFSITIVSIALLAFLIEKINVQYLCLVLALGPALGLYGMYGKRSASE